MPFVNPDLFSYDQQEVDPVGKNTYVQLIMYTAYMLYQSGPPVFFKLIHNGTVVSKSRL